MSDTNKSSAQAAQSAAWRFEHSYLTLPDVFYSEASPHRFEQPRLVRFNHALAEEMGLHSETLDSEHGAEVFSGRTLPMGSRPIAQAYAGHQFGHFTMLGDGRAILLGEHRTPGGHRLDVQLKGQGPTSYSRRGDGRATLGPMLREYIVSEAMHALGIPTSRSLAVCTSGETVYRESGLPGAVLTRIASSHLRVGTFEFAASISHPVALQALVDYTISRHFPECHDAPTPALALLESVIESQADLIARWMLVGFVHGVMNTDNMAVSGETIDYGPCAFIDTYDPTTVFSSIDRQGRYAYGNQPKIALWNLSRFAESLLPLIDANESKSIELAKTALSQFNDRFDHHWLTGMRAKLGIFSPQDVDRSLANELLAWMETKHQDFTNTFRNLDPSQHTTSDPSFIAWQTRWHDRLASQPQSINEVRTLMNRSNPVVIPRNHHVEAALTAAVEHNDIRPLEQLLSVLSQPFESTPASISYQQPPPPDAPAYQTFCGT